MAKKTKDIEDFTKAVLKGIREPWPEYITFLVFLAIENNDKFLQRYQMLVDKYNQTEIHKGDVQGHVNATIGRYVKVVTGREVISKGNPAKSSLIGSYSKLG